MPLTPAKCTNCGGILEVDSAKDAAICPFCNTPYVVEKAINNYNSICNVNAASVNFVERNADELFKHTQTLIGLGAYEAASKKYIQMMESFPADSRGWTGTVQLAVEHHTPLSGGETHLNPLKVALKLGDKEFLNWLYQNFDKDEQVVRAGVAYIRELGSESADVTFFECLNRHFEKKCQRIRSGKSNIIAEFGGGYWENCKPRQLGLYCDCLYSVKTLLEEAKENGAYFASWIDKIGMRHYHSIARETIKELWGTNEGNLYSLSMADGGFIGSTHYYNYDGSAGDVVRFCDLCKVITHEEIDRLFHEILRRCNERGICPRCGGRKRFFSNKCSSCGSLF